MNKSGRRRATVVVAACLATLCASATWVPVQAAPGDLDPQFGNAGRVITDLGGAEAALDAALQPDGKLVVVGTSGTGDFALVRYDTRGVLDPAFGNAGSVLTDFGGTEVALATVVQPDGKLVVAGRREGSGRGAVLARYNANGVLDPGFGAGGKVMGHTLLADAAINGLVLEPDGKIVAAGRAPSATSWTTTPCSASTPEAGSIPASGPADGPSPT